MNKKWRVDKIGRVCTTTQGVQIPLSEQKEEYEDGYIRYLYIGDFKSANKILYVKDEYPQKKVSENDLVMANTGSPGVVFKGINGVLSNNLFKISFDKKIFYRDFLYLYLYSDIFQSVIQSKMKGGIQKHLGHKTISEQNIVIPPLDEQKKIAEILNKASNLISIRKRQIEKLDLLVKAKFVEMFGDISINYKGWNVGVVDDVIDSITAGWSANGETREKKEDDKAVLKVSAVTRGVFNPEEYKVLDSKIEIKKYVYPQKGDLLFSRANTRELVGATCIIYQDYPDLILPDKLWKLTFNNKANVYYMKYILSEPSVRTDISSQSTGTSGSMYNVSMDKLKNIKIPLPPLDLQTQFASFVEQVEQQKAKLQQGLVKLELNYKALMQQYFG